MKINFAGPGQVLLCEKCEMPMEDAFASMNPDEESHWCDGVCQDFRGGIVRAISE